MKGISLSSRWLKFLVWPGIAGITAGLVVGSLSGWSLLSLALLLAGTGLLLLGFSFSGKTAGAFWQRRSTQAGTNAVVATLAMLTILGLLNFLAVQNAQRLDLTETQLFTLAPASKQVVQALDRPVRLVIFDRAQNPQDVQLLESYRRAGRNFTFEYIDPYANPSVAETFGVTKPGMVFLEVGNDRRFLQTIGSTTNPQSLEGATTLSERQITNALEQVISDRSLTVYFTQGHKEPPIEGETPGFLEAAQALRDKRYEVLPLNLAETKKVPADASVVVVAGPVQDFFPAEVDALKQYVNQGGGLFLMLNPRADVGLNPLLDDWGVVLDDRIVLDTSGAGQFVGLGPAAPIVSDYGDHPITQEFANGRSFFPLARPVESTELPEVTATPLLLTNAQSRAEAVADDGNLTFDPNAAPSGPYVLGYALSRPPKSVPDATKDATVEDTKAASEEDAKVDASDASTAEDLGTKNPNKPDTSDSPKPTGRATEPVTEADEPEAEPATEKTPEDLLTGEAESTQAAESKDIDTEGDRESRLVIIGNATFATDGVFNQQLNGDLFLNAVNWLGQASDTTLSIRPKTVTDRRLQITGQQAWGLGIFSLLVLPLTGLALALVMALRRR